MPNIDEGILTIDSCDAQNHCLVESDFIKPDKTTYELRGLKLDGYYLISPQDRNILMKWVKANCKYEE